MNVVNKSFFNNLAKSALLSSLGLMPLTQANAFRFSNNSFFNNPHIQASNLINNTDNKLVNIAPKINNLGGKITNILSNEVPIGKSGIYQASFKFRPRIFNFRLTSLFAKLPSYLIRGCFIGASIALGKDIMNKKIQNEKDPDDLVRDDIRQIDQSFTHKDGRQRKTRASVETFSSKLSDLAEKLNKKETALRMSIKNSKLTRKLESIIEERKINQLQQLKKQLQIERALEGNLEQVTDRLERGKEKLAELISGENDAETEAILVYNFKKVSEQLRKTEKELTQKQKLIKDLEQSVASVSSSLHEDL